MMKMIGVLKLKLVCRTHWLGVALWIAPFCVGTISRITAETNEICIGCLGYGG